MTVTDHFFKLSSNLTVLEDCRAVDYEYYYYYEDELPQPVEEKEPEEALPDYDLTELVAAWKEYIRDKAEKEASATEDDSSNQRRPQSTGTRRRPSATGTRRRPSNTGTRRRPAATRRPRPRPRPEPVIYDEYIDYPDYEEYECEPRSESYRVSDPVMCDK